jgi:hypothetical protein
MSSVVHSRGKEISEAYSTQKLGPDTICNGVDYLTTILSRVYVSTERSFAEWHVNDLDNGIGYRGDVRIRRCSGGKALLDLA